VDAQSSTKPPTPGALPRQKKEKKFPKKTPQDSSSKTTAKQSLDDAQSSTEEGGL